MSRINNRRVRLAAIAAMAATASVMSMPMPAFASPTDGPVLQLGSTVAELATVADEGGGEGETETLTPAEDASLTAAGYGTPVRRAAVMERAKNWYNRGIPYSQSAYAWDQNEGKKYRTDCSGFVSMAWRLKTSLNTRTLQSVSHVINWNDMLPGDAVIWKGHHTQIFDRWVNEDTKADFWVYEQGSTATDMNHKKVNVLEARGKAADGVRYLPYRYNGIRK